MTDVALMNLAMMAGAVLSGFLVFLAGTRAIQIRADAPLWSRLVLGASVLGLFLHTML